MMGKIETIKWIEDNIARLKVYPLGDIVNNPNDWNKHQQNIGGIEVLQNLLKKLNEEHSVEELIKKFKGGN